MMKTVAKGMAVLSGLIVALAGPASAQFKYWNVEDTGAAPKLISQSGLYVNLAANKNMIAAAVPFEVNSALWSDATHKQRWVLLKPNTGITYSDTGDYWTYPDSAVFIKDFNVDTVPGDTLTRVKWETRFLILKRVALDSNAPAVKTEMWYGYSYKWRKDQKEADLVPDTGLKATIKWYPNGRNQAGVMKKWIFPPRDKCLECHRTEQGTDFHGRSVLGFFTAQLNMPSTITPGVNQLDYLFTRGVLKGVKPANWSGSPKWHSITSTDPAATLEKKARAYIAANCSGCHGSRGMLSGATFGVDFNYDYYTGTPKMKFEYRTTSWSYGLDTIPPVAKTAEEERFFGVYLVTPGYPQKSVILHRQRSRNTTPADDITAFDPDRNQMPPSASFEVNTQAMQVINSWIAALPKDGAPASIHRASRHALASPAIQGRHVHLPPGLAQGNPEVRLLGIDGRVQVLPKVGNGVYAIPTSSAKGVYILQVGRERFTRYLF